MKGNNPLFSSKRISIANGDINFMPKNGDKSLFGKFISKRPDIDPNGTIDIIAHGSWKSIEIHSSGKDYEILARLAAKIIKRVDTFKECKSVRLLSCNTGSTSNGFAQQLANSLGKPVIAPNSTLFSNSNGKYWVGKTNHNTRGEFIVFKPGGGKYETK